MGYSEAVRKSQARQQSVVGLSPHGHAEGEAGRDLKPCSCSSASFNPPPLDIDSSRETGADMVNLVLLAVAVGVMVCVPVDHFAISPPSSNVPGLNPNQLGFMDHIDHIVFVVMENHAYDNFFGTYCQLQSPVCPAIGNGLPGDTCVPYNPTYAYGACIRPWNFTAKNWSLATPLPHTYLASHAAWNNGLMDGFYAAEGSGLDPFGHYNGSTVPIYWDLAQEYELADNFYSSILSYSLPNHWHIVAGQAPQIIAGNSTIGCPTCNGTYVAQRDRLYLSEANHTRSIEDLLLNSDVSWKYYDFTLGSYSHAIGITLNQTTGRIGWAGHAFNLLNPQAAKAESYNASFTSHFVYNTQFYGDARNGTLPSLSWLIPPRLFSDHPPQNSTLAQTWLASVVDAVEASPDWNTTALYITWDDYGGFYDHVDPPTYAGWQLGFRVPLIVVSPYTRAGAITSSFGFFESVLRLMEWRFGLGCITFLDCRAPLPIFGFDWSQTPRAPMMFPTDFSLASYPYSPDWNESGSLQPRSYAAPTEFTYLPNGQGPDVD